MARAKRPYRDDNPYTPVAKRHAGQSGLSGKNNNSAASLRKNNTPDGAVRKQEHIVIDLSGNEEQPLSDLVQRANVIMKPLPPKSSSGDFPLFDSGAVYIIIDSENIQYQYRLHRAVLSRISPALANILRRPCPKEAAEELKAAKTNAETRLELTYSRKHEKWMLSIAPFTVRKHTETRTQNASVEHSPKALCSATSGNDDIVPSALSSPICINSENAEIVAAPPGDLSPCVPANEVAQIKVMNNEESNFTKDSIPFNPIELPEILPPVDHVVQSRPIDQKEQLDESDNIAPVKGEDDVQADDQPIVKIEAAAETKDLQDISISTDPDHLSFCPGDFEDYSFIKSDVSHSNGVISLSENKESQVSTATDEADASNDHITTPLLVSANTVLDNKIVESAKFEENPSTKAEEDESGTIKSSSNHGDNHQLVEAPSSQEIDKLDSTTAMEQNAVSGPPIEICEAYNNLFLTFYHKPPNISNTSTSNALSQCETLISIADRLQCLPAVRPYLANAIGRFGKQLHIAIVREPFRWLKLSIVLESASIFKESMIHIVGAYVRSPNGLPADIPLFAQELILSKVRQMQQQRREVNERLFASSIVVGSHTVTFSAADAPAFSTWLVVQIWRDWFCRQMAGAYRDPARMGALYRTLARAGDAYLAAAEVEAVVERISGPARADVDELSEDLGLLKKFAQEAVKDLCVNNSVVDVQEARIEYLTCATVGDEELPWFQPPL